MRLRRKKRVGVALGGGGARGWSHLGALAAIEEAGIAVDFVAGTSMGALVGGIYAAGHARELREVAVQPGQAVRAGEKLAVIEAMKMENILKAEKDCTVKKIVAQPGESLSVDQVIVEFE